MAHHAVLPAMAAAALLACASRGHAVAPFVQEDTVGFVLSHIEYALSDDAEKTGACPLGMSSNVEEIFARTPEGQRREGEADADYAQRLKAGGRELSLAPDGQDLCMHPEAGTQDPFYRTVAPGSLPAFGIDIDGLASAMNTATAPTTCPHDDFIGMDGEPGVDNQFFRAVGCNHSFQSTGQSNTFATQMLTGSWGILINLKGVDDIYNDDSVEVEFLSNADPIKLSPGRMPLPYATYTADQDARFRAVASGWIENGVLTTQPTDVRFHYFVNSMLLERPLKDARLQATLTDTGELTGYLAGYTPLEEMYDLKFGFRNGTTRSGELAPLKQRRGTANGAAYVLGHTCHGAWFALYEHADGHPDPETGKCTSLSTQYRIRAIPAFVVEADRDADLAVSDE